MTQPANAHLLAAEANYYTAQLAYDMCAAQFDIASRALTAARTDLFAEQQRARSSTLMDEEHQP